MSPKGVGISYYNNPKIYAAGLRENLLSLQFSRSLRSLSTDSFRAAKIGIILAMAAIVALVLWFFFAKVTIFENSDAIQLTEQGRLLVAFPKETIGQIRPGQAALLRLQQEAGQQNAAIPGMVFSTDAQSGQAEILIIGEDLPVDLTPGEIKGLVSVEAAYVTPVSLLMQATGYRSVAREVPVSPQSLED